MRYRVTSGKSELFFIRLHSHSYDPRRPRLMAIAAFIAGSCFSPSRPRCTRSRHLSMVRSCSNKITEGSRKPLSGPIRQCAGSASLPGPLLCNGSDNHRGAVLVSKIILENDHGRTPLCSEPMPCPKSARYTSPRKQALFFMIQFPPVHKVPAPAGHWGKRRSVRSINRVPVG